MKARFLFLILLFQLNASWGFTQNYVAYHRLCNEAEVQIRDGNLLIAQGMLGHAFTLVPKPKAIDCFNLAKCYSQTEKVDSTLKYLELALANHDRIHWFVKNHYLWFQPQLGGDKWEELMVNMQQSTVRTPTLAEEEILKVYYRMDSISDIYPKIIRDSIYIHFPKDTALIAIYADSMRIKSMEASQIFDNLCISIGQIPDSHPYFQYQTYFSCRNFPLEWFEKNEAFLYQELQHGRFLPSQFLDYILEKHFVTNRTGYYSFFVTDTMFEEKLELTSKYGCSFDLDTRKLREMLIWPYD